MRAITLKDIAQRLNMSVSTVSKALSGDAAISELTKERVRKQAAEWNYIPNEAARNFKLNKTFTIGLIIPSMMDQFYVMAINGVEKIAGDEKYNVIISQSHEDTAAEERIVDLMKRNRVDGLIITITKNTKELAIFKKLEDLNIPVVFVARTPNDPSFNSVTANNEEGAYKATKFLLKKGHTRVAHIMGPSSLTVSNTRLEGYKRALASHKIKFAPELVQETDLTAKGTIKAMKALLKLKDPPTAIFTFKNYISLDAIEYLKKNEPKKLDKIDFTGFGNLPLFQYLDHKPIASIEESSYEMGEEAARQLFLQIKKDEDAEPKPAQHIKIECKLIVDQR